MSKTSDDSLLAYRKVSSIPFCWTIQEANNESSEVVDILLLVTFYFNPSTRLDNVKNLWRFIISIQENRLFSSFPCIQKEKGRPLRMFTKTLFALKKIDNCLLFLESVCRAGGYGELECVNWLFLDLRHFNLRLNIQTSLLGSYMRKSAWSTGIVNTGNGGFLVHSPLLDMHGPIRWILVDEF